MGSNDGIYVSDRCGKTVTTLCAHSYGTHIRAQCDWQLWCCDILRCMVATNDTPGTAWHCECTPPNTLISESCWNTFHYCTPSLKPVCRCLLLLAVCVFDSCSAHLFWPKQASFIRQQHWFPSPLLVPVSSCGVRVLCSSGWLFYNVPVSTFRIILIIVFSV